VRTGREGEGGDDDKGKQRMHHVQVTTCHGDGCSNGLYSAAGRGVARGALPTTHKRRPQRPRGLALKQGSPFAKTVTSDGIAQSSCHPHQRIQARRPLVWPRRADAQAAAQHLRQALRSISAPKRRQNMPGKRRPTQVPKLPASCCVGVIIVCGERKRDASRPQHRMDAPNGRSKYLGPIVSRPRHPGSVGARQGAGQWRGGRCGDHRWEPLHGWPQVALCLDTPRRRKQPASEKQGRSSQPQLLCLPLRPFSGIAQATSHPHHPTRRSHVSTLSI